jgi:hypothetical protein
MESVKHPATIISVTNTAALIAIAVYGHQQLTKLRELFEASTTLVRGVNTELANRPNVERFKELQAILQKHEKDISLKNRQVAGLSRELDTKFDYIISCFESLKKAFETTDIKFELPKLETPRKPTRKVVRRKQEEDDYEDEASDDDASEDELPKSQRRRGRGF